MTIDWTLVVAAYAAIVGTGTMVWTVYIGLRDRASLQVGMSMGTLMYPAGFPAPTDGPLAAGKWTISLKVTNRGRRPLTLDMAGFDLPNGGALFLPLRGLPAEIKEGGFFDWPVELRELRKGFASWTDDPPTRVWIRDSSGRKHYGRIAKNALYAAIRYGPWGQAPD